MLRFDTPTARLRSAAFLEGTSYVLLLFVAMPLKYFADMPLAVRIIGSLHGALFLWLAILVWEAMDDRAKPRKWGLRVMLASLVPFGTYFLDKELRRDDEAYRERAAGKETREP